MAGSRRSLPAPLALAASCIGVMTPTGRGLDASTLPCADYADHLRRVGGIDVPGGVADVAVDGGTMYAAASSGGLLIFDVSRPREPVLVGSLSTPGPSYGLCIDEGHCYLADGPNGMTIIDVRDRANPVTVGSVSGLARVSSVTVSGDHAYLTAAYEGLIVVDVADRGDPRIVGQLDTPRDGDSRDVEVRGTHAWLCDGSRGLHVVDLADPTAPRIVVTVPSLRGASDIDFVGSIAYVAAAGSLVLLDVADPLAPAVIRSIPAGAGRVSVQDGLALVSAGAGIILMDVSDPSDPEYLGGTGTDGTGPVAKLDQVIYVASRTDIDIVDATNPTSPAVIGSVLTVGRPEMLAVRHGYGFTVSCSNSSYILETIDFRNPTAPVLLPGSLGLGIAHAIDVQRGFAYVAATTTFRVVDVRDPARSRQVATAPIGACDVVVKGRWAFVAGYTEFVVVDVSDPANPTVVARFDTPGVAAGLDVAGGHAFVATYDPLGGLFVIDVDRPERPEIVATLKLGTYPNRVTVAGGYAFLRGDPAGTDVVDVRDPLRPQLVGRVPASSCIEMDDEYAYLCAGDIGVMHLRPRDRPTLVGSVLPLGLVASDIEVRGGFLYFAGGRGAGVLPLHCAEPHRIGESLVMDPQPSRTGVRPSIAITGPNPFSGGTSLRVTLPQGTSAEISVYDVIGRLIRRLGNVGSLQGPRDVTWDGRNEGGRTVSSGTYFVRLDSSGGTATTRLVRIQRE